MTDPNALATRSVSFDDLPDGGDNLLAELFGATPAEPQASPNPSDTQPFEPAAPGQPPASTFRLSTKTGTVYNSIEDAQRGIETKDALIEHLRSQVAQTTGADPLRRQAVPQEQLPVSYIQNPQRFLDDLVSGAENDPNKYVNAQLGLFNEYLAPLAPAIKEIVVSRAEKAVRTEMPDFDTVRATPEFTKALEVMPDLKQAIDMAENNFQAQEKLPGLYKLAYLAAQGLRMPEMLKAQQPPAVAPQAPRQPISTTHIAAPTPSAPSARPSMATNEGRKALMEQLEQLGVRDLKF